MHESHIISYFLYTIEASVTLPNHIRPYMFYFYFMDTQIHIKMMTQSLPATINISK